jgi:hypothetical protein
MMRTALPPLNARLAYLTLSSTAQVICDLAFLNKKFLKQKNLKKIVFLEKCFFFFFASGLSPYNDAFLTYSARRKKNSKMQVTGDLGRENPATLERKKEK